MLLLIFFFNFIKSENQSDFNFNPRALLKSYIYAIQNQEFQFGFTDDFAVYDCKGRVLSGSDFNIKKLNITSFPIKKYRILRSDNQSEFNVRVGNHVSTFELFYVGSRKTSTKYLNKWKIKSEKHKTCLFKYQPYYSSLLIDYEKVFNIKAHSLLKTYIKNLEFGQFPKHENFTITEFPDDKINLTSINPVIMKLIQNIPTISSNRFNITASFEDILQFYVLIDNYETVIFDVIYNANGKYEIVSERHDEHLYDDWEIVEWYTSAFIDYRKTYLKIVEKLMEKFENAVRTKTLEDEMFSIKNINISELGYYTTFLNYQNIYIYGGDEERQQFSILNYDERLTQYSFTIENNKFHLISDLNWNSIDHIELIYSDKAESLMSEYKETLLADKIELKNIFSENFRIYICGHGSLNITQFEKELEKPGNIMDFGNYEDDIELVSVNSTNGDIDFVRNKKARFLAKYNFDLKKYELSLEYRCKDDDFFNVSYSKGWENAKNLVEVEDEKVFKLEEPLIKFGKGWMFDAKPTIIPFRNFNATSDSIEVANALNWRNGEVYNDKLIEIMCRRSQNQRQEIAKQYYRIYQNDLSERLEFKLHGDFAQLMKHLLLRPVDLDIFAMRGDNPNWNIDGSMIIEILMTRTHEEIQEMKNRFQSKYGHNFWDFGKNAVFDFFHKKIYSLERKTFAELSEVRREESLKTNRTKALEDAIRLHEAVKKDEVFLEIFAKTNLMQLQLIFQKYHEYTGKTIRQLISSMGLYNSIVDITQNRWKYFSNKIETTMRGRGTDENRLNFYIISRSERDLESIRKEFDWRHPRESLTEWIRDDTFQNGPYQRALLALIRGNRDQ